MSNRFINGFELIHLLGSGGMAEVWYAENEIQKPAAVKILNEDLAHNASIVERFHNEAKLLVRLEHPNIRQVYSYGSIDGRPAIVMEYLDGADLKARMTQGQRFTDDELKRWWNQIVDALKYTHEQGVVHRDIKPSNIFVDKKGDVKLLDFGIAKVRESIPMTLTGTMMGTLIYMSPEQVDDSKRIGPKSDIYSLAVTFVNLLTSKAPYDTTNNSDFKIRESIVYKPLDLSDVPADWQTFLTPYLEKDPSKRPELQHFELSAVEEETRATTRLAMQALDMPSGNSKNRKGLWIGLASAVVATIVVLLFLRQPAPEPEPPIDPCAQALLDCQTADDVRNFIRDCGPSDEAQQKLEALVTDSIKLAEASKFAEAEEEAYRLFADSPTKENGNAYLQNFPEGPHAALVREKLTELKDDASFAAIKTIADCDNYIKEFPQGRHIAEVKALKTRLEQSAEDEAYKKCTTIAGCKNYLKNYPNGRYVTEVQKRLDILQLVTPEDLPISLGYGDLTQVKLIGNYLEYVVSINEAIVDIESIKANSELIEDYMLIMFCIAAGDPSSRAELLELKLGVKYSYVGKSSGKKHTITISPNTIADVFILGPSPTELLDLIITETNDELPAEIIYGIIMKRIAHEGNYLVRYFDCDEDIYDIESINSNISAIKKTSLEQLKGGNILYSILAQICKNAKVGIKEVYRGTRTGKKATITIYPSEL